MDLLACKFLDADGVGYVSGIIDCLDYCVRQSATISSNSYALDSVAQTSSAILLDALWQAGAQGHIFIAAAGECG